MIRVGCPACGQEFDCADFLAGLTVVCKGCGHRVPVPGGKKPELAASDAVAPAPKPVVHEPPREKPAVPPSNPRDATPLNERAEAMLDAGMPVPLIEQRLVELGMTADVANALMIKILDERARRVQREEQEREKKRDWLWYQLSSRWWGQLIISAFFFAMAVAVYQHLTHLEEVGHGRINVILALIYGLAGKWGCVLAFAIPGSYYAVKGIRTLSGSSDDRGA